MNRARSGDALAVDIWVAAVPDAVGPELLSPLSNEERRRAERFRHAPSRDSYITAHALVRHALSARLDVRAHEWTFATEPGGRPFLTGPAARGRLRFSLAHCVGLAACAIAEGVDVGIDAEDGRRPTPIGSIAGYFATPEQAALEAASDSERRQLFFRYWTLKESYVKARGTGLTNTALAEVSFTWDAQGRPSARLGPGHDAAAWVFESWSHGPFELACCIHAGSQPVNVRRHELDLADAASRALKP